MIDNTALTYYLKQKSRSASVPAKCKFKKSMRGSIERRSTDNVEKPFTLTNFMVILYHVFKVGVRRMPDKGYFVAQQSRSKT